MPLMVIVHIPVSMHIPRYLHSMCCDCWRGTKIAHIPNWIAPHELPGQFTLSLRVREDDRQLTYGWEHAPSVAGTGNSPMSAENLAIRIEHMQKYTTQHLQVCTVFLSCSHLIYSTLCTLAHLSTVPCHSPLPFPYILPSLPLPSFPFSLYTPCHRQGLPKAEHQSTY